MTKPRIFIIGTILKKRLLGLLKVYASFHIEIVYDPKEKVCFPVNVKGDVIDLVVTLGEK